MFHGQGDDVAFAIDVEQGIFIQIARFGYFRLAELDVQRIGIVKELDVQGA